ncbi:MAG TPA: sigma-70 family RNA polymerase sigma factor [Ktedonobacteraceae bacterium]
MSRETLPTIDELNRMDDLSSVALYRTEVQRLSYLTREQQAGYIGAAQAGDTDATHALVLNCLNWVQRRARAIYRDREPQHTDVMDLVGTANMQMLEAVPKALRADDPVSYLMTVASNAMRWQVTYHDPLVTRQRDQPLTREHPMTVSLEDRDQPITEAPASSDCRFVYDALQQLSKRHQMVLAAAYGLNGERVMKNEDIAAMLHVSKGTVEKYLWRAKRRLAAKLGPYLTELGIQAG